MDVEFLWACDIDQSFLDVLGQLRPVGLSVEEAQVVWRARIKDGVQTYVVRQGGVVVGTASLFVERKFIHGGGKVAHVEDVVVDEAWRNKGVGSDLVGRLVEEARKAGAYKLVLGCLNEAAGFYERCGLRAAAVQMRVDL